MCYRNKSNNQNALQKYEVHFHILDLQYRYEIYAQSKDEANKKFMEQFNEIPDSTIYIQ